MANIKIVGALIIVLAIDLFLFFGQTASMEIANADPFYDGDTFLHGNSTWMSSFGSGNVVDTTGLNLPEQNSITAGDESLTYTDQISVTTSWIKTAGQYLHRIIGAPVYYVQVLKLPPAFSFGVGAFWYGLSFFLVVAFILGRE